MLKHLSCGLALLALVLMFGCQDGVIPIGTPTPTPGAGQPTPTPTPGAGGGLTIVKTSIDVRHDAGLECGDDLIAFGTGTLTGISYIVPSTNPTAGTPVTDGTLYDSSGFAVGGKNIFMAGSNSGSLAFQVSVFNTTSGTITKTFTADEIQLKSIPITQDEPGNIRADGNYCVVICDQNEVTDGKIIKVIDASAATPTLIAFSNNPVDYANQVEQVAVDGTTKKVVAVADDTFFIYDITNPTAAPVEIAAPNGVDNTQIKMKGNYIIAFDDRNYPETILVNLTTNAVVALTEALGAFDLAIGDTKFAFFADADSDDSIGGTQRAAVGTIPGPGFSKAALDVRIDGSTTNNGSVGFASTMCMTPNSAYVFLAGGWYLQYSAGTASFTVPDDPKGEDVYGCPAWDIDCTDNTVGFKTALDRTEDTSTKVGYIVLD